MRWACLDHESARKRFPTGGWGWAWTGDPDRGNDWRQPGGWIYNILPYIEQQPLHDLGAGWALGTAAELAAATQCAARRWPCCTVPRGGWPIVYPWSAESWLTFQPGNMNRPVGGVARTDYAICGGDIYTYPYWPHPIQAPYSGPRKLCLRGRPAIPRRPGRGRRDDEPGRLWPPSTASGVSFCLSMIGAKDVTDGLSNTYLLGEKYLDPDYYCNGSELRRQRLGDGGLRLHHGAVSPTGSLAGESEPRAEFRSRTRRDTTLATISAAPICGFNMALCDGSVRMISYSIDMMTHIHLANRHDGQVIDPKKLLSGSNGGHFLIPILRRQLHDHDHRQPVGPCDPRVERLPAEFASRLGLRRGRGGWRATDSGWIRGPIHVRQGGLR